MPPLELPRGKMGTFASSGCTPSAAQSEKTFIIVAPVSANTCRPGKHVTPA